MSRLTHRTAPGVTYFVTTDAWQKTAVFQVAEIAEIVVRRILACRDQGSCGLHEFVLMPNHLHLLLTPGPSCSLEKVMMLIKGRSSHEIHLLRGNRAEIWQAGFHDWTIRDSADFSARTEYIRMNPVVAKLVERPEKWPYSSASGKFRMDPAPNKRGGLASAAKADSAGHASVGAEAPTP